MTQAVGEILNFRPPGFPAGRFVPAIVTVVHEDNTLDLTVFLSPAVHDPTYSLRAGDGSYCVYFAPAGDGEGEWQAR